MKIEAPCQYLPQGQAEPQAKKPEDVEMKNENDSIAKAKTQLSELQINESSKTIKIDVPDLFANVRIKDLDNWLQYPPLPHGNSGKVVPDYYIRHFDKVNDEFQNTVENNWSFKKKNYEINEQKIEELMTNNIKISPNDYEWVIDHFEKTAINDQQQSAPVLIEKFRERGP